MPEPSLEDVQRKQRIGFGVINASYDTPGFKRKRGKKNAENSQRKDAACG